MADWLAIAIGLGTGLALIAPAMVWAFRPRKRPSSRLPPESDSQDPMTAHGIQNFTDP